MPQKTWAVGEEVLAADFNTYVQNQVTPTFATTAARDAGWTSPPNGALSVTTDTYTLWMRRAGAWTSIAPVAVSNTGGGGTTSGTAEMLIVNLTVPAQPVAGRLALSAMVYVSKTVATDFFYLYMKEGAGLIAQSRNDPGNTTAVHFHINIQGAAPANTARTFSLYVVRAAGTGTATFSGDGTLQTISALFIPN